MTSGSIFGFVLALVVAQCAAIVWLIFETQAEKRAGRLWRSTYESVCKNLREKFGELQQQSPTELAVRVAELDDAVKRLAKTHQRFAGRFDQYVHEDSRPDNSPPTLDRDALRRANAGSIVPPGVFPQVRKGE